MSHLNPYALPTVDTDETESRCSDSEAFDTGLHDRDKFLGVCRCVVCGVVDPESLKVGHIVDPKDTPMWDLLRGLGWVPKGAKDSPAHECRNGMLMCVNHQRAFEKLRFFIRYQSTTKQYIFVLYDSCGVSGYLKEFHGKAIALDVKDIQAPLPLLLLSHEYRVRGRNFYQPKPHVESTNDWQEWMVTGGVVNMNDDGSFMFNRNRKAPTSSSGPPAGQSLHQVASTSGSRTVIKPPTVDLIYELIACQLAMPSLKACQGGNMGWEGTAEENMKKYVKNVVVESVE